MKEIDTIFMWWDTYHQADQFYISVIPTLLGAGIRLFGTMEREIKLNLLKTQTYNGITDLVYTRR